jgi:hypothetical protein
MAVTAASASGTSAGAGTLARVLSSPWKIGGIAGIGYVVMFVIGGIVLQGETPMRDDDIETIRRYWADDSNRYLVGDWLVAAGFILFFLPFVSALRSVLGPADPSGGVWSRLVLIGGVTALLVGAAASMAWGALALSSARDIDDSTLRLAMDMDAYGFATLGWGIAAFLLPTSVLILLSGALWRWTGIVGIVAAVLMALGALWVVSGDEEGVFGVLGFIAFPLWAIWTIAVSVCMLMRSRGTPA